jgi:hypothetical protein
MSETLTAPAPDVAPAAEPASTPAPSTDVSPSGPTTSQDIAARTLASLEQAEAAPEPEPEVAQTAPDEPVTLSDAESILRDFGFKQGTKPDGREHYIPRSKVVQALDKALKVASEKAQSGWSSERTTLETARQQAESALQEIRTLITGDPAAFLQQLSQIDARYANWAPATTQTAPALPADATLEQAIEWKANQILEQRLKPLQEREAAREREQQMRSVQEKMQSTVSATLKEAESWPFFGPMAADGSLTPFQQSVLDDLKIDSAEAARTGRPPRSFEAIYIKRATAAMTEKDQTARERILAELQKTPASTGISPSMAQTPRKVGGMRSTADIAADVAARLERQG